MSSHLASVSVHFEFSFVLPLVFAGHLTYSIHYSIQSYRADNNDVLSVLILDHLDVPRPRGTILLPRSRRPDLIVINGRSTGQQKPPIWEGFHSTFPLVWEVSSLICVVSVTINYYVPTLFIMQFPSSPRTYYIELFAIKMLCEFSTTFKSMTD